MGELHLAEAEGAGGWKKRVALKTVLPHLADDSEFVDRFLDEARIAGRLSHANIVPVFDCGEDAGTWYLAMEYVDGWDVRRLLKALRARSERLPVPFALRVGREIAEALSYAHQLTDEAGQPLDIVHRDVTPANILVSRAGDVRLTDFGVAAARGRLSRTTTGQLRGTFYYMSPEQAAGRPLDGRSDVFSVGALLYELLSGARAFDGDNEMAVLSRVQRGEFTPLGDAAPELDASVVEIVERTLALDPAVRTASARALADALNTQLARHGEQAQRVAFARWLERTFPGDRGLGHGPAGPSLDDILNAQLDQKGRTPTGSGRSSATGSSAGATASREQAAQALTSVTMTRAATELADPLVAEPSGTFTGEARRGRVTPIALSLLLIAALIGLALALRPPPTGSLAVGSTPPGAEIFVDGVQVGVADLTMDLAPGTYTVRWRLAGHAPVDEAVEVVRRSRTERSVTLEPVDRSVQFFSVPPGASVQVGDAPAFVAGNAGMVPVGRPVRLRMELAGHVPIDETVSFATDAEILTRTLEPLTVPEEAAPSVAGPEPRVERVEAPRPRPAARASERTWRLRGAGEGATVYIDGERDAAASASGQIRAPRDGAPLAVRVVSADGRLWAATLDPAERGGTVDVAYPSPAEMGRVMVVFGPLPAVGDIYVDGIHQRYSTELREALELPPGEYRVEVRNNDQRDAARLRVVAGETVTMNVDWR